jgi:hypothetical protein
MQAHPVRIDVIYAESEREVLRTLQRSGRNTVMVETDERDHPRAWLEHTCSMADALKRSIGIERIEASGDGWLAANNDCVEETRGMDSNSVDLIVTSIPFANHYEYTPSYNDFGHTDEQRALLVADEPPDAAAAPDPEAWPALLLPREGPDQLSGTSPAPASRPSPPSTWKPPSTRCATASTTWG